MPTDFPPIIPSEDFWSRQANAQKFSFEFAPFGVPTEITANDPAALTAAQLSSRRFSRIVEPSGQAIRIQIVVCDGKPTPLPDDLPERLMYSGVGDWITVSAGERGHGFANLQTRQAFIFLSPTLAADARLVSRYFIDHYILNFLFTEWAMLHASCVLDPTGRRVIMLMGAHHSGKSTTALRLARAGYPFLSDGMVLMRLRNARLVVGGYPVGEVKLRNDALSLFPEYRGETVQVREHQKTVVDLRAVHPDRLAESLVVPSAVQLCVVELGMHPATDAMQVSASAIVGDVTASTVYWNTPSQLEHNTAALHHLLRHATLYRLRLSDNPAEIVATMDNLI